MILHKRIGRVKTPVLLLIAAAAMLLGGCDQLWSMLGMSPTADAGMNQTVTIGEEVTLNASGSVGEGTLTYKWQFTSVPSGSDSVIDYPTEETAHFTPDSAGIYTIKLTVFSDYGDAIDTLYITAEGASSAPATPTGLAVGTVTSSSIGLSWNVSIGATSYKLYRNGSYLTAVSGGSTTSYTDTALGSGLAYSYTIAASNAAGDSDQSTAVTGTTTAVSLTAPSNLRLNTAQAQAESVALIWDAPAANVMNYKVMRLDLGSGLFSYEVYAGASTSCIDNVVDPDVSYSYKVMAYYGDPSYAWSALSAAFTTVTATLSTAPAKPANLSIGAQTDDSLTLYWSASAGADGYHVYRLNTGTSQWDDLTSSGTTALTYTNSGLAADTNYSYMVKAYKGTLFSDGATVSGKTSPAGVTAPSAPTGLAVSAPTETSLVISWDLHPQSGTITGLRLQRKTSISPWIDVATNLAANQTNFTNFSLSPGTGYSYQLFAYIVVDSVKYESAPSNIASGSTIAAALPPNPAYDPSPWSGSTDIGTAALILGWAAPTNPDGAALHYEVYVGVDGASPTLKVQNLVSPSWSPLPGVFQPGEDYSWYVKTIDTHGHFSYSPTWYFSTAGADDYGPTVQAWTTSTAPFYTGTAVAFAASVTPGSGGTYTTSWAVVEQPAGSTVVIDQNALAASFTPAIAGDYTMAFTAIDDVNGLYATSWVSIIVGDPGSTGGATFIIH